MSFYVLRSAACAAMIMAPLIIAVPAAAQQNVMKECGNRWQAAKSAKQTEGQTWQQFLAKCRAELATQPAAGAAKPAAQSTSPAPAQPAAAAKPAPAAAAKPGATAAAPSSGTPVFPARVDPKYANESASIGRRKTCLDQYNANKAANNGAGNAGRTWIQKGGGYYSECNRHLKGG